MHITYFSPRKEETVSKTIRICAEAQRMSYDPAMQDPCVWKEAVCSFLEGEFRLGGSLQPDLILFPEMCDLPKGMDLIRYASHKFSCGDFVEQLAAEEARRQKRWIACSTLHIAMDGTLRNACLLYDRSGNLAGEYNKIRLTQGELDAGFVPGAGPVTVESEFGRLGFVICFDLNYLELARQYQDLGPNLILFPSLFEGGFLKQVWALVTDATIVCACGEGSASVTDASGTILSASDQADPRLTAEVQLEKILVHQDFQSDTLSSLARTYPQQISQKTIPGLGAVLLESHDPSVSIQQIIEKYHLESRTQYLKRMARLNQKAEQVQEKILYTKKETKA